MADARSFRPAGTFWTNTFSIQTIENILFGLTSAPSFSPDGRTLTFTSATETLALRSQGGLDLNTDAGTILEINRPSDFIKGLTIPFSAFMEAVRNGDPASLNGLVWGGNDTINGGASNDTISGFAGNDSLYGADGADRLFGEAGADTLFGDNGKDVLLGGAGADVLNGGADDDRLLGGAGNDRIIGGAGLDTLYGGAGADTFIFKGTGDFVFNPTATGSPWDSVMDFNQAQGDRINLSAMDANFTVSGNQAFTFIGAAAFTANTPGTVRVSALPNTPHSYLVEINSDADDQAEATLLVVSLATPGHPEGPAPVAADFIL